MPALATNVNHPGLPASDAGVSVARPRPRLLTACALTACAWSLGLMLVSAFAQGTVYDERFHLDWARRLLASGETERLSHPNFDSKTPLTATNVLARRLVRHGLGVTDERWLVFATRLPGFVWLGGLLLLVFTMGRSALGLRSALVATTLVALDPNLIAHAALAQVDVGYALGALATVSAAWVFWRRPTLLRGALLGAATGFAFNAKFAAVLLLPAVAWPLLASLVGWRPSDTGQERGGLVRRTALGLLVALAVFALLISAAYGFQGVGQRLDETPWQSGPLRWAASSWGALRLPMPVGFLTGIDICLAKERAKMIPVTALGHEGTGPVWYYFLVGWLTKTPIGVLLGELAGLVLFLARGKLRRVGFLRWLVFLLALHAAYFSLLFRYQIGYRFVLMCVPWLALLAGAALVRSLPQRALGWSIVAIMGVAFVEQAGYVRGDLLAFTNVLVYPKRQAFALLGGDSNLDYGQNDDKIGDWLTQGEYRGAQLNPVHLIPGRSVFNIDALGKPRYAWLRAHLRPAAHIHHAHLVYEVTPAEFDRFLEDVRRVSPVATEPDVPAEMRSGARGAADAVAIRPDRADDAWCVFAAQQVDVSLVAEQGQAVVGPGTWESARWELISAGQAASYRLAPGLHVFRWTRAAGFAGHGQSVGGTVVWWRATRGSEPAEAACGVPLHPRPRP